MGDRELCTREDAVDHRLIHIWHHEFSDERAPTRPAAPTFIEGSRKQVVKFLDELSEKISPENS